MRHVRRPSDEGLGRPTLRPTAGIVVAIGDCATLGRHPGRWSRNPSDSSTGLQFDTRRQARRLTSARTSVSKARPARHQRPGLPGAPGLDLPDHRRAGRRPRRRHRPRRAAAPGDVLQDVHRRPAARACSSTTYKQIRRASVRAPGTRLPVLRVRLPRPDDPLAVQPHPAGTGSRSKTRAGQPCYGCTEPEFPHGDLALGTVFKTQKVAGVIPKDEPAPASDAVVHGRCPRRLPVRPRRTWSKESMFVV